MSLSLIDILFLATVALLVFNGLRNGAVFSLINLLSIPLGFAVAYFYGPRFTLFLAENGLPATPLISYLVLFFGTSFVLHIVATMLRGIVQNLPVLGAGDALLGGAIGFVEAWLLWLVFLILLANFLQLAQGDIFQGLSALPDFHVPAKQFASWHDFYNQAVHDSLFAKVNSLFVKQLPGLPRLPS